MFWIKDINIYQLLLLVMDISIIEYIQIFSPFYYENSNNKDPKKPKNTYYDRLYLCVEKDNSNMSTNGPIKGFDCFRCNHLEEADKVYRFKFSKQKQDHRFTIIPICKYIPFYFDPLIVDYKLKKRFWLEKHTFLQRSKKDKE
jgi:hypothetical protein